MISAVLVFYMVFIRHFLLMTQSSSVAGLHCPIEINGRCTDDLRPIIDTGANYGRVAVDNATTSMNRARLAEKYPLAD